MKVLIWGDESRYRNHIPTLILESSLELIFCPREQPLDTLFPQHADADFLFVDAIAPVSADLIDKLPNLKLIHSEGVAYNSIDIAAAKAHNIFVCNNKGCNAAPTAEMAVMLMLMTLRFGISGHNAVRSGEQITFKEHIMTAGSLELGDCTVGLVGFGDIAQSVARRLLPFGCQVYYYAPHRRSPETEADFSVQYLPLEELFATCNIVSLHCAVTPETTGMVNESLLHKMKAGSILINTARGDLIDNLAVRQALLDGTLGGAGFDVLAPEPTPATHPLVDLPEAIRDKVVYAPHLGGITSSAFTRAHTNMFTSVYHMMQGERPANVVNGL